MHPDYLELEQRAQDCLHAGKSTLALALCREALAFAMIYCEEDGEEYIDALLQLADVLLEHEAYAEAEVHLNTALPLCTDPVDRINGLLTLGDARRLQGRLEEVEAILKQAQEHWEQLSNDDSEEDIASLEIAIQHGWGRYEQAQGHHERAEQIYQNALKMLEDYDAEDWEWRSSIQEDLVVCLQSQDKREQVIEALLELRHSKRTLLHTSSGKASSALLLSLAQVEHELADWYHFPGAYFLEAEEEAKAENANAIDIHAISMNMKNTPSCQSAFHHIRNAIEMHQDLLPANHEDLGRDYFLYAEILWNVNEIDEAENYLDLARIIFEHHYPQGCQELVDILDLLHWVYRATNRSEEAHDIKHQSLEMAKRLNPDQPLNP